MAGNILRVQQPEPAIAQSLYQGKQSDFGGVGHSMKHRFAKKCAGNADAVQSANQLFVESSLNGMSKAKPVEIDIAGDDFFADPGFGTVGTGPHDRFES